MHNGAGKIIGVTGRNVIIVNPETGNIDWTFNDWGRKEEGEENIAVNTPLCDNGRVLFSFGYDIGTFMLRLGIYAGDAKPVWRNNDLDTYIGGFVLLDGIIYGSNWINNEEGNWVAVDWNKGETKYQEKWNGRTNKGSIIAADGMLYCHDELGMVGLIKPDPGKFNVVSEFRITKGDGPHWAHPVIQDGILYIRHGTALMAYNIKAK